MDQEADVALFKTGDFFDFLVAQALLEFQEDAFALILGKLAEGIHDFLESLAIKEFLIGRVGGAGGFLPADFIERLEAFVFAEDIEGAIAADREKPGFEICGDIFRFLVAKPDEGVLDHIASAIDVVENRGGISDEWGFIGVDGMFHELFAGAVGCVRVHGLLGRNARRGGFLRE